MSEMNSAASKIEEVMGDLVEMSVVVPSKIESHGK